MPNNDLKFGVVLAPPHAPETNRTDALQRDLQLIEDLDQLGYDAAWFWDQFSTSIESLASSENFITAAAKRTARMRLGMGVSYLPGHQPLQLANHLLQLDQTTRGRVEFGFGTVAPANILVAGIEPTEQKTRMREAIEVLAPLLRGETVTRKTRWFELQNEKARIAPYTKPMVPIAAASQVSPAGARIAGTHGLRLLSLGATSSGGFNALAVNWEIYSRTAKRFGHPIDRVHWSLAGPVHLAESREQAFSNIRNGLDSWLRYFRDVVELPIAGDDPGRDVAQVLVDNGLVVIGTVDDAIAQLHRLLKQSGGFGTFLQMAHHWADREQTLKSYQLFAEQVIPVFQRG